MALGAHYLAAAVGRDSPSLLALAPDETSLSSDGGSLVRVRPAGAVLRGCWNRAMPRSRIRRRRRAHGWRTRRTQTQRDKSGTREFLVLPSTAAASRGLKPESSAMPISPCARPLLPRRAPRAAMSALARMNRTTSCVVGQASHGPRTTSTLRLTDANENKDTCATI